MRDLKNMIEFEDLLLEAYNDMVRQAKSEGKLRSVIHATSCRKFY